VEKNIKDIRFALNWKKPSKSAGSINKGNIVLVPVEETTGEGPHTSEKINSKGRFKTEVDAEKRR
jgi:hypothetical protein